MQRYGYFTQPPNNMLKKYVLKHKNEVLLQKRGNLKPSIRIIRIKFLIFVAITKNNNNYGRKYRTDTNSHYRC